MQECDKQFKLILVKETWSEETGAITKIEKTVNIYAPTVCEAIVRATKQYRDYTFKCIAKDI